MINSLLFLFCGVGLWAFVDTLLSANGVQDIEYKELLSSLAFIGSTFALWLNFSNRELHKSQIQHENARKLRSRFYNNDMKFFRVSLGQSQREENDRTCHVEVFYNDDGEDVRWKSQGTTALGMASAGVMISYANGGEEEKRTLERGIINTVSIFEESISLLSCGLITKKLIKSSLNDDFSFVYRVIAKIVNNYTNSSMMDLEKLEIERLNKKFEEIFGVVEDQNITVERKHISQDVIFEEN